MKVVQLFSRETRNMDDFDRMNADHRDAWRKSIKYEALLFSTIEVATGMTIAVIIGDRHAQVLGSAFQGVYGNNDLERDSLERTAQDLGMTIVDPPLRLEWGGRALSVVHDPRAIDAEMLAECDFVLHGHSHLHVLERRDACWVFNPGECAGIMTGLNAIGVVDLETETAELLRF